jgi:hypothetical protein
MKESYSEDLASHAGPELYAGDGNIAGVATTGAHAGQVLSSEMRLSVCRPFPDCGKATSPFALSGKRRTDTAESQTLSMHGNSKRENREIPSVSITAQPDVDGDGTVRKHHRWYS